MGWPFLYFAGERLSTPELMAARLDGDVVEIGEAFMPADAVETRELRAGSLRGLVTPVLAVTHETAAWVHGAIPEPPLRHRVQRAAAHRIHHIADARLHYRDQRIAASDVVDIAGLAVATPVRTLADLVRDGVVRDGVSTAADAVISWRPELIDGALAWFERAGPVHFKRAALAFLRARQEEVTRYTS